MTHNSKDYAMKVHMDHVMHAREFKWEFNQIQNSVNGNSKHLHEKMKISIAWDVDQLAIGCIGTSCGTHHGIADSNFD